MKAVDRLGDDGVRPAMGSHGGHRRSGRLLQCLEKEGMSVMRWGRQKGEGACGDGCHQEQGRAAANRPILERWRLTDSCARTLGKEEGGGEVRAVQLG
jgi:hypothetical protein